MTIVKSIDCIKSKHIARIASQVGNTPLWPVRCLSNDDVKVFAKVEWMQIGSSIKARAAFEIIKDALLKGLLTPAKRLLDATSGNTGIAYAAIGASLGLNVTICLPANASSKRKSQLKALGAELILTSPLEGTDGAQEYAQKLADKRPDLYFYADQYKNANNWKAHYYGTSKEILKQTNGSLTHFVSGMGTTGTIVGNAKALREYSPAIEIIGLQPDRPLHGLEGWKHLGTAKIPGIYNEEYIDKILEIESKEAFRHIEFYASKEGWLLSPSSAANLLGAARVAESIDEGVIVTVLPDDISKYDEIQK